MGAISGLIGTGGGVLGTGVSGPQSANIANPVTSQQISNAYTGTQNSLASQGSLLSALQGQNGLENQSQVYGQLQGVANGTGPNPAQAQLAQATGQNIANQAALAAGQRGASSNVGLMARQAAMQGNAAQQNAAGQAATLQANQSLNAINSAGTIANTQAANQIGQTNANTQAQQAEQSNLLNAQSGYNSAAVGTQSSVNAANAGLANSQLQGQQAVIGGVMNGAGTVASMLAGGGDVADPVQAQPQVQSGPQSQFGQYLTNVQSGAAPSVVMPQFSSSNPGADALKGSSGGSGGGGSGIAGLVALLSNGGSTGDYRGGGKVNAKDQSQKAVAPGNSYANDKIPAVLSEHEIVIPRSITMGRDPIKNSALFVAKELQKRGGQK